jgi:uncharacterized protein
MSMLLDLRRLRSGVERVHRRFAPEDFPASDDFRVIAPVELEAEVRKDGQKARFVGRIVATLECGCSRCLEPYRIPVDAAIDSLLLPASAGAGEAEQEIGQDDLGVSFYRDDEIDLGELIREQFYLALPMKPLCDEDCRGLCPVCGINRNRETCTCQAEWVDPRLEGLRQFK